MALAPIALFAYNRPTHLQRAVEALRGARLAEKSRLWVFSDGPKRPQDAEAIGKVRAYAHTIEGFASVAVVERDRNLGLSESVTTGVRSLCEEHGRLIVLEDDLLIGPGFLEFMNRALDRYAEEERVMQVSGYMYPGEFGGPGDSLFLPTISCWGWSTWKRAWNKYDPAMTGYEVLKRDRKLRHRFDLGGAYDYFDMLEAQAAGKIDSWGIRWYLNVFLLNGLVLYPSQSMVCNTGVDGSGRHGGNAALHQGMLAETGITPLRFPNRLEIDEAVLARIATDLRALRPGLFTRLIRRLVA
jgi:hypothetical protein